MKTTKRMAATALAATSTLAGLAGAFAPGASAANTSYSAHIPGTHWSTKAACQPYADNYKKIVASKGDKLASSDVTTRGGNCFLESDGWTYRTLYSGTTLSGDVKADSQEAWSKITATKAIRSEYEHSYAFPDAAKCNAALNGVLSTLNKRNGTDVNITYVRKCNASDSQGGRAESNSYTVGYEAKPGHAAYGYENIFRTDMVNHVYSTGRGGADPSIENLAPTYISLKAADFGGEIGSWVFMY